MHHRIPIDTLGARAPAMAAAVQSCVHCGFCLPTCPTYGLLGEEMDSPRGRIVLMKGVLEGTLPLKHAKPHIDACLGCLACETACPSGVAYRDLISPFRAWAATQAKPSLLQRLRQKTLLAVLPHPERFAIAAALGRLVRPFRQLLPAALRAPLDLLPPKRAAATPAATIHPAIGERRATVALLAGCAQQVLAPEIQEATIRVLQRQGVEVHVPPAQGCCGALAWHIGHSGTAAEQARRNLSAFAGFDAVITNAAGCGSAMHEYPLILAGTPHEAAAHELARRTVDISVFLQGLPFKAPPRAAKPVRVVLQDACHLLHGQQVQSAPRELLSRFPGVTLLEPEQPELCCGSAGTYNLDHPELAARLGRQKAARLMDTEPDVVVTGNIGCQTQLRAHLPESVPILHLVVLLDRLCSED